MKLMNENAKGKIATKLGDALINLGEKSTKGCYIFGNYESKISIELLKSTTK